MRSFNDIDITAVGIQMWPNSLTLPGKFTAHRRPLFILKLRCSGHLIAVLCIVEQYLVAGVIRYKEIAGHGEIDASDSAGRASTFTDLLSIAGLVDVDLGYRWTVGDGEQLAAG